MGCARSLPAESRSGIKPKEVPSKGKEPIVEQKQRKVSTPQVSKPSTQTQIPTSQLQETKDEEAPVIVKSKTGIDALKQRLSGAWTPDRLASASLEPILTVQGLPYFKRKTIQLLGPPSEVIDFIPGEDGDEVRVLSVVGLAISSVTVPLVNKEPCPSPSILEGIKEDEAQEVSNASLCKPAKEFDGHEILEGKCLKISTRLVNGDKKTVCHAIDAANGNRKLTHTLYYNHRMGQQAGVLTISLKEKSVEYAEPPANKSSVSSKENQPQEDVKQTKDKPVPVITLGSQLNSVTENVVFPTLTNWLLPTVQEEEKAPLRHARSAPEEPLLKFTSSTTGVDDFAAWLNPTPKKSRNRNGKRFETASMSSSMSIQSESIFVNPFEGLSMKSEKQPPQSPDSAGKLDKSVKNRTSSSSSPSLRSMSPQGRKKTKSWYSNNRQTSQNSFFTDEENSPESKSYTFRDEDEVTEFEKIQKASMQILERFRAPK